MGGSEFVSSIMVGIIGAIIGFPFAVLATLFSERYNIYSPFGVTRRYRGFSSDFDIKTAMYGVQKGKSFDSTFQEYKFNGDFYSDKSHIYLLDEVKITFYTKKVYLRGSFRNFYSDGTQGRHKIFGSGKFISGNKDGGLLFIDIISREGKNDQREVYFLRFSRVDRITGYFICESYKNTGKFEMGPIELEAT